jgi:hypothetical protein
MTKYLAAALLTTALFTCTATAQTASNKAAADSAADRAVSAHKEGEWRASKLVGVNVYNDANEKIGDINDVVLTRRERSRTSSWALVASSAWANTTSPSPTTS